MGRFWLARPPGGPRYGKRGLSSSPLYDGRWDKRRILVAAVAGGMALLLLVPIVMQIFILAV